MTAEIVAIVSTGRQVTPESERQLRKWSALGIGVAVAWRATTLLSLGASLAVERRFFSPFDDSLQKPHQRSTPVSIGAFVDATFAENHRLRLSPTVVFDSPPTSELRVTPWISLLYGYSGVGVPSLLLEAGPSVGSGLSGYGEVAWQFSARVGVKF